MAHSPKLISKKDITTKVVIMPEVITTKHFGNATAEKSHDCQ